MARPSSNDLSDLLAEVEADPTAWEFFALLRRIEGATPDLPRIGAALDPAREAVDLAHQPSAEFPRTTIAAFARRGAKPAIRSQFLGLTGPMGPLPFHLTEVAIFERGRSAPSPFADFLDLLSARMLQAFYRAWADSQPHAQADRPADDRFAAWLGAVSGAVDLRFITASERPEPSGDPFDDWHRLAYGGHFAGLHSASAIGDLLSQVLGRPVAVTEAVGRWRAIPAEAQTRLGARLGRHNQLGLGASVGQRFFAVEWDVAFTIRAQSMADVNTLLPGGELYQLLARAADAMLPPHLEWQACVEVDSHSISPAQLGRTRLGHTSWMAPGQWPALRSDLHLSSQPRATTTTAQETVQ